LLRRARSTLHDARRIIESEGATSEGEGIAREALALFRSAMDWLEDSDRFENAHQEMDAGGNFVRQTFGCWLHQRARDDYLQTCPVARAHEGRLFARHDRASGGMFDLPSRRRRVRAHYRPSYEGEECHRILRDIEILEISVVARPAQPDARIMAQPVPVSELRKALPPDWKPGIAVSCDRCLTPCDGVHDPLLEGHNEPLTRRGGPSQDESDEGSGH
jgi:hypothetical protein